MKRIFLLVLVMAACCTARTITGTAYRRVQQASDTLLYTILLQNIAGETQSPWVEVGCPVAPDVVTGTQGLVIKNAAGESYQYQQFDQTATFNESMRFTVASLKAPSLGNGDTTRLYVYRTNTPPGNTNTADIDSIESKNYTVDITIGGTVWTASCNDALNNNTRVTASGAARKSWRAIRSFYNGATEHAQMWVCWYVDLWQDNTVSVMPKITNGWFANGQAYSISGWSFKTGETTIRSGGALAQHHHSAWFACDTLGAKTWSANTPKYHHRYHPLLFGDSRMTFYHPPITPYYNRAGANYYTPGTYGTIDPQTGGAGDRADIGQLPNWSTTALVTQNREDCRYDYTNSLAWAWAPFNYTNKSTGEVVVLDSSSYDGMGTSYPYGGWWTGGGGDQVTSSGGTGSWGGTGGQEAFDPSHHPEPSFHPYLRMGHYWLLDQIALNGNQVVGWNPSDYRCVLVGDKRYYAQNVMDWQVRNTAWSLRAKNNAAYIYPDAHPAKNYLTAIANRDWELLDAWWGGDAPENHPPLSIWQGFVIDHEEWALLFHEDYTATSVVLNRARGFDNQSTVDYHTSRVTMGRGYVTNGFYNSIAYEIEISPAANPDNLYTSWSDVRVINGGSRFAYLSATSGLNPNVGGGLAYAGGYVALSHGLSNAIKGFLPATDSAHIKAVKIDSLMGVHATVAMEDDDGYGAINKYYIRERSECDYGNLHY